MVNKKIPKRRDIPTLHCSHYNILFSRKYSDFEGSLFDSMIVVEDKVQLVNLISLLIVKFILIHTMDNTLNNTPLLSPVFSLTFKRLPWGILHTHPVNKAEDVVNSTTKYTVGYPL